MMIPVPSSQIYGIGTVGSKSSGSTHIGYHGILIDSEFITGGKQMDGL
jgi:hypothetical protein